MGNQEYIWALEEALVEMGAHHPKCTEKSESTYNLAVEAVNERRDASSVLMEMKTVKSSNIAAVGYSEDKKELRVEFANTGVYQYRDIPKEVFDQMLVAQSVGSFFSKNIRNQFKCVKLK